MNPCEASQRSYSGYGTMGPLRPALEADAAGRVGCPVCGKRVKLLPRNGVVGSRSIIPTHKTERRRG